MSHTLPVRTEERLRAFESTRRITVASLEPLRQVQMDFNPAAGQWSLGEIADHLLKSEQLYRGEIERLIGRVREGLSPYVKYTFKDIDVRPFGLPISVLSRLERPFGAISRNLPDPVRSFLTLNPIVPARNPQIAAPRTLRPAAELVEELRQSMRRTRALLVDNADIDLDSLTVDHPVTGVTNVSDILQFLERHERRHQQQMEAVRRAKAFPPLQDVA